MLVAPAGPVSSAAALRDSVLCRPTDVHSLLVNENHLNHLVKIFRREGGREGGSGREGESRVGKE